MDLQRLGAKLYASSGSEIPLAAFVPVFHRWIQTGALPGTAIDVVDYAHVHHGPGIVLIGFEAHLSVDEERGERGLAIDWKQPLSGSPSDRFRTVLGALAGAARLLETDTAFGGRLRFGAERLTLRVGDRALAPNDDGTWQQLRSDLQPLLDGLYAGSAYRIERDSHPKRRLGCEIRAASALDVATLLTRLG